MKLRNKIQLDVIKDYKIDTSRRPLIIPVRGVCEECGRSRKIIGNRCIIYDEYGLSHRGNVIGYLYKAVHYILVDTNSEFDSDTLPVRVEVLGKSNKLN